jgi:diguanylate cyclase (GGDEF)-like protein
VWTLVLLDVAAAVLCGYGALNPPLPGSPAELNALAAVLALAIAATVWRAEPRAGGWLTHANLAVYLAGTGLLVANAATGAGGVSASYSLVLVVMYAAVFLPRWVMRTYLVAVNLTFLLALAANAVVDASVVLWLPPAATTLAAGEVLSSLTRQLRDQAVTDELTGLPNRAGFLRRTKAAPRRQAGATCLAVVDLDGFKAINDGLGHAAGDALLVDVTREWIRSLRGRDAVYRFGGDEFVFVLDGASELDARLVMARLQATSTARWTYGLAVQGDDETLQDCLARADRELYLAKRARAATGDVITPG